MANIELFGKIYNIKDFYCGEIKGKTIPRSPGIILYIRINNECNGKCKFCLNCEHKSLSKIDTDKLKDVINYLKEKHILSTITITGGEPMIDPGYLNKIINAIVEVMPEIEISLSTNGTNLGNIVDFDNINNIKHIHISRHHYNDKINENIIGSLTVSTDIIRKVQKKLNNIIINTVMCKGYIDSAKEVEKMCDYAYNLNIKRIHLVSLINYNKYCVSNYVDVNKILKKAENKKILSKIDSRYRKEFCECHYYQYKNYNIEDFVVMSRLTHKNHCNYVEQLVYTNDNYLISGFDSNEIIY